MIDGVKTLFSCHHPIDARWSDEWSEGCRECNELRFNEAFHVSKGRPWDPYWPPVHRVQISIEGNLYTYSQRGELVSHITFDVDEHLDFLESVLTDVREAAAEYRRARSAGAKEPALRQARAILLGALMELVEVVPASYLEPAAQDAA